MRPAPALIEIVERHSNPTITEVGIIKPNEVRINGIPLLVASEPGIKVHGIDIGKGDVVMVTLTLFARRVVIADEIIEENEK